MEIKETKGAIQSEIKLIGRWVNEEYAAKKLFDQDEDEDEDSKEEAES